MKGKWVVSDSKDVKVGEQCPTLGVFDTELAAAIFIEKQPGYLTGRYNLDPPDEEDQWEEDQ